MLYHAVPARVQVGLEIAVVPLTDQVLEVSKMVVYCFIVRRQCASVTFCLFRTNGASQQAAVDKLNRKWLRWSVRGLCVIVFILIVPPETATHLCLLYEHVTDLCPNLFINLPTGSGGPADDWELVTDEV